MLDVRRNYPKNEKNTTFPDCLKERYNKACTRVRSMWKENLAQTSNINDRNEILKLIRKNQNERKDTDLHDEHLHWRVSATRNLDEEQQKPSGA